MTKDITFCLAPTSVGSIFPLYIMKYNNTLKAEISVIDSIASGVAVCVGITQAAQ